MTLTPDDPRHGKASTYPNHGRRCDACRAANTSYPPHKAAAERYRRRLGQQPRQPGRTHGRRSTYNRGCRCPECTEAIRLYQAAYRARRKATT